MATKEDATEYERLLSCLVEPNQAWAKAAPVLALGVVRTRFTRNDKPNAAAVHDLGAASAQLTFEATARSRGDMEKVYEEISGLIRDGVLCAKVAATYGLEEVKEAVAHQTKSGEAKPGKIVLLCDQ